MPRLGLLVGMVSLTFSYYATMPSDNGECAKPPNIRNAIFLGSRDEESYPKNHTAQYSCHPGYVLRWRTGKVLKRTITMTCLKGKWVTESQGRCRKKPCGHPGDTSFGQFELRKGRAFVFGAVVEYSCDEGYQMVSKHKNRTCAADGWTNSLPHCEARLCPPVWDDSVRVVSTVTDDEYSMGHVVTFQCKNPKGRLSEPSELYCTANGTWNMDPPTCKESCTIENSMRNNNIQLKDNGRLHYGDNEDVQFECITGYKISDPAELLIQCNRGILKYPTCHKTESCTIEENSMSNNNIWLKDNGRLHYGDNEDVQFECISGYKISDPAELLIQCNKGILRYPSCHKTGDMSCGRPPYTKHGEITSAVRNSYHSGSSVRYMCQYLHKLHGRAVIECRDGKWDDPPLCLEPCTTNGKVMSENHIQPIWNNHCVRDDQRDMYAKKCYVPHDDMIQFACLPGYRISNPQYLKSKCNRSILSYPKCFNGHFTADDSSKRFFSVGYFSLRLTRQRDNPTLIGLVNRTRTSG